MLLQSLLVACLVSTCFVYAACQLLPRVARQALARAMLRWPLPAFLARGLEKVTRVKGGCGSGCDGCDRSPTHPVLPGTAKKSVEGILVFHPALRRHKEDAPPNKPP